MSVRAPPPPDYGVADQVVLAPAPAPAKHLPLKEVLAAGHDAKNAETGAFVNRVTKETGVYINCFAQIRFIIKRKEYDAAELFGQKGLDYDGKMYFSLKKMPEGKTLLSFKELQDIANTLREVPPFFTDHEFIIAVKDPKVRNGRVLYGSRYNPLYSLFDDTVKGEGPVDLYELKQFLLRTGQTKECVIYFTDTYPLVTKT